MTRIKKLEKKLVLNKETVSNLNKEEMKKPRGGGPARGDGPCRTHKSACPHC